MSEIIKIVALFLICNGAGCNCSGNLNGGSLSYEQIAMGFIIYGIGVLIRRYDPDENA